MARITVVDDKENILKVLKVILEKQGHVVEVFKNASQALEQITTKHPDVIVSDIRMEPVDGRQLFYEVKSRGLDIPFMFMTAYGSIDDAVRLMKEGAVDYMSKPLDYDQLNRRISLVIHKADSNRRTGKGDSRHIIGSSSAMRQIFARIEAVADTGSTILIEGESGTGKELVARAIHKASSRSSKPFVAVNCSAFQENLLESELFGHERGAFTDAVKTRKGVFEYAQGGTLFLDEASELSGATQAKLLRVLQERSFMRVGGNEEIRTDVRIIAATNRKLSELVSSGEFREDLYYRLHVIPFFIPPLREHTDDIAELAVYFAKNICEREGLPVPEFTRDALEVLKGYRWPGNVRELEHIIERVVILSKPRVLDMGCFLHEPEFAASSELEPEQERARIGQALESCGGNRTKACRMLGISRRTLYNKLARYNLG